MSPEVVAERVKREISVSLTGYVAPNGRVYAQLRPSVISDNADFKAYREATKESKYVRHVRKMLIPIHKVTEVMRDLREAGFAAEPAPQLFEMMKNKSAGDWLDRRSVEERIQAIGAEFKARTGNGFYPFQRTGAIWLSGRRGALLADDMGLGKTLQGIAAFPANAPILVVGPVNVKSTWRREVLKWRPSIRTSTLEGRGSFRWPSPGEMVIINYDILPVIHDAPCIGFLKPEKCPACREVVDVRGGIPVTLLEGHKDKCTGFLPPRECSGCAAFLKTCPPGLVLVGDEAHRVKSKKADRTKRFRALSRATLHHKTSRVWLLTGTPLENEPRELWSVLEAAGIAEEAFDTFKTFVDLFKGKALPFGGYSWGLPEDELSSNDITERLQRVSLRRRKVEVLPQLPTRTFQFVDVDVDKKALRECERFLKTSTRSLDEIIKMVESETIDFRTMSIVRQALAAAKIPAMLKMVEEYEEANEPVVVFSSYVAPIEALEKRRGWRVIKGGVSSEERGTIQELFQEGILKGIGLTIRAGGEGITLTRANQGIFVDLDWAPTKNSQAEDRLIRIGQTRGVVFKIMLAEHPLDQRVTEVLHRKSRLISASVDKASVRDDAPEDPELEALVKTIHMEIESGATRTLETTKEENRIIDWLHTRCFENPVDGRLAVDLAQEAMLIGLTPSQWRLAEKIADAGLTREDVEKLVGKKVSPALMQVTEKEDETMAKEEKKEETKNPPSKLQLAKRDIRFLEQDARAKLIEWMGNEFCLDCAAPDKSDEKDEHDCPFDEEEDDSDAELEESDDEEID